MGSFCKNEKPQISQTTQIIKMGSFRKMALFRKTVFFCKKTRQPENKFYSTAAVDLFLVN